MSTLFLMAASLFCKELLTVSSTRTSMPQPWFLQLTIFDWLITTKRQTLTKLTFIASFLFPVVRWDPVRELPQIIWDIAIWSDVHITRLHFTGLWLTHSEILNIFDKAWHHISSRLRIFLCQTQLLHVCFLISMKNIFCLICTTGFDLSPSIPECLGLMRIIHFVVIWNSIL